MIEIKANKGNLEKIICSGTPLVLVTEIAGALARIFASIGDEKVKRETYDLFVRAITDRTSPAYKEIFPSEEPQEPEIEFNLKDIFRRGENV